MLRRLLQIRRGESTRAVLLFAYLFLVITSFVVTYAGAEIFRADVFPGVAANPYFAFTTTATETGEVVFTWTDDRGDVTTERRTLTVT